MIKRYLWLTLGLVSLAMAYIGVVTPGIPFSIFLVFSAYCFSKSSKRLNDWLYQHKIFGPFLTNWSQHRIFPKKLKYAMAGMMLSSLIVLWLTVDNLYVIAGIALVMLIVAIWAWRYPSTITK